MTRATMPYTITLTAAEYRDAAFMCARGYLAEITIHAEFAEWTDDEDAVTLHFSEAAAWECARADDEDPYAVWALTTPETTLGAKVDAFLNAIV